MRLHKNAKHALTDGLTAMQKIKKKGGKDVEEAVKKIQAALGEISFQDQQQQ